MAVGKIPHATAKRLPIYYRYLNILADEALSIFPPVILRYG